jgi:hypothetical protein
MAEAIRADLIQHRLDNLRRDFEALDGECDRLRAKRDYFADCTEGWRERALQAEHERDRWKSLAKTGGEIMESTEMNEFTAEVDKCDCWDKPDDEA